MCDVLDLSVRCQSQQLPSIDDVNNWTTSTTLLTQVNPSPPWSNSTGSRGGQYQLEPISPSSSPDLQSPPCVARRELDVFYPRQHVDNTSQQSPAAAGRWSSEASVAMTSTAQLASSEPRQWNGNGGHPYSPLKRVLHQYRNSVKLEENSATELNNGSTGTTRGNDDVAESPLTSSTTASTASTCRKPTTTTAGKSFEEFVLGMLSKVGGGKAITAATQSYLRETAATASNRSNGTVAEARTTGIISTQPQSQPAVRPGYDDLPSYQTSEQRRQLERQMLANTINRDEYSSPYHHGSMDVTPSPELLYPSSRPSSDLRLIASPLQQSLALPGTMRRPLMRPDDRDDAYRERRRKNNEAAKRSRDTRRFKELQVAAQAERLAEENLQLKAEIAVLRSQLGYLHRMMLDNNNGSCVNSGSATDEARPDDPHSSSVHHHTPEDGGRTV